MVKYWPGDVYNQTYGPFMLGMNFVQNITQNSFSYVYKNSGKYNAKFLVQNDYGTSIYNLNVTVYPGVHGLVIDVQPPNVLTGNSFVAGAYLIQGGPYVKYNWTLNDIIITTNRKCKFNVALILQKKTVYLKTFFKIKSIDF